MKTQQVMNCLAVLYDQYGPPIEKTAEAQYFYRATARDRTVEALGRDLVKIATNLKVEPWSLAIRAARSIEGLQKVAARTGPYQNIAQFYVDWANDIEKRAANPANLLRAGFGTAKSLIARPWTSSGKMTAALAGKTAPAGTVGQTFGKELRKAQGLTDVGGGSYGRGKQMLATQKAERAATKAKAVPAKQPAAPAQAAPAQTAPAAPSALAPAAAPTAEGAVAAGTKPFFTKAKGDIALGTGLLGVGAVGGGYVGNQMAQPPQPQMDEMYY
jgi:hypothetical protein